MAANVLVMGGLGQVGSALAQVLSKKNSVYILDLNEGPGLIKDLDFLHVCIPYTENFVGIVYDVIEKYKPKYTVIHSTVPVGTTRQIGGNVCHSPVRGQHNDLKGSLLKFSKYMGSVNRRTAEAVKRHLEDSRVKVVVCSKPEETELTKLLCLSRYLNDLAFYEAASSLYKRFRVNRNVMKHWTQTYNEGYKGTKWVRPELDFPNGKVGGHCVIPVSKMLVEQTEDEWFDRNLELFR